MTTTTAAALARPVVVARRAPWHRRWPQWWIGVPVAVAVAALAWIHRREAWPAMRWPAAAAEHVHGACASCMSHGAHPHSLGAAGVMWAAMVLGTMLPATVGPLGYVALNSFPARRRRAMALFTAVFTLAWLVAGVPVVAAVAAGDRWWSPRWVAVVSLAGAGLWQWTRAKRRAVLGCQRVVALRPVGRRADASVTRYAWLHATRCARSCAPLMVAMLAAPMGLAGMGLCTALTVAESRDHRALHWRHITAVALVGYALVLAR